MNNKEITYDLLADYAKKASVISEKSWVPHLYSLYFFSNTVDTAQAVNRHIAFTIQLNNALTDGLTYSYGHHLFFRKRITARSQNYASIYISQSSELHGLSNQSCAGP